MPLYHWLGAAMAILSLAGFLIYALGGSAAMVELVAGVRVRRCTRRSGPPSVALLGRTSVAT